MKKIVLYIALFSILVASQSCILFNRASGWIYIYNFNNVSMNQMHDAIYTLYERYPEYVIDSALSRFLRHYSHNNKLDSIKYPANKSPWLNVKKWQSKIDIDDFIRKGRENKSWEYLFYLHEYQKIIDIGMGRKHREGYDKEGISVSIFVAWSKDGGDTSGSLSFTENRKIKRIFDEEIISKIEAILTEKYGY